jgi:diguanylate cyclase (GGDEF)-like protein
LDHKVASRLDQISEVLYKVLNGKAVEPLRLCGGPKDEVCQLAEFVNRLVIEQEEFNRALEALSRGDLEVKLSSSSRPAQNLKAFQATLKHLVWQTGQVAQGDYTQRIDFLGTFSDSFNHMVMQLESDRHQLAQQMADLERLATTDVLTGLPNRRRFMSLATDELVRWNRYESPFCLLMFDLDRFKSVNDTYGHAVGDEVLKCVAQVCRQVVRDSDLSARIGGEEFVVMYRHTRIEQAQVAAERLRQTMAQRAVPIDSGELHFSMSGGLVQVDRTIDSVDELLGIADVLLYEAKEGGRNRVVVKRQKEEKSGV